MLVTSILAFALQPSIKERWLRHSRTFRPDGWSVYPQPKKIPSARKRNDNDGDDEQIGRSRSQQNSQTKNCNNVLGGKSQKTFFSDATMWWNDFIRWAQCQVSAASLFCSGPRSFPTLLNESATYPKIEKTVNAI